MVDGSLTECRHLLTVLRATGVGDRFRDGPFDGGDCILEMQDVLLSVLGVEASDDDNGGALRGASFEDARSICACAYLTLRLNWSFKFGRRLFSIVTVAFRDEKEPLLIAHRELALSCMLGETPRSVCVDEFEELLSEPSFSAGILPTCDWTPDLVAGVLLRELFSGMARLSTSVLQEMCLLIEESLDALPASYQEIADASCVLTDLLAFSGHAEEASSFAGQVILALRKSGFGLLSASVEHSMSLALQRQGHFTDALSVSGSAYETLASAGIRRSAVTSNFAVLNLHMRDIGLASALVLEQELQFARDHDIDDLPKAHVAVRELDLMRQRLLVSLVASSAVVTPDPIETYLESIEHVRVSSLTGTDVCLLAGYWTLVAFCSLDSVRKWTESVDRTTASFETEPTLDLKLDEAIAGLISSVSTGKIHENLASLSEALDMAVRVGRSDKALIVCLLNLWVHYLAGAASSLSELDSDSDSDSDSGSDATELSWLDSVQQALIGSMFAKYVLEMESKLSLLVEGQPLLAGELNMYRRLFSSTILSRIPSEDGVGEGEALVVPSLKIGNLEQFVDFGSGLLPGLIVPICFLTKPHFLFAATSFVSSEGTASKNAVHVLAPLPDDDVASLKRLLSSLSSSMPVVDHGICCSRGRLAKSEVDVEALLLRRSGVSLFLVVTTKLTTEALLLALRLMEQLSCPSDGVRLVEMLHSSDPDVASSSIANLLVVREPNLEPSSDSVGSSCGDAIPSEKRH